MNQQYKLRGGAIGHLGILSTTSSSTAPSASYVACFHHVRVHEHTLALSVQGWPPTVNRQWREQREEVSVWVAVRVAEREANRACTLSSLGSISFAPAPPIPTSPAVCHVATVAATCTCAVVPLPRWLTARTQAMAAASARAASATQVR